MLSFFFPWPHLPVPVSETVCGLLLALSFGFIVAVRVPVAFGENFTLMMQCDLVGTLLSQVLVSAKSPGSAPVKVMPLKISAVERLLVSATVLKNKTIADKTRDF